MTTAEDKMPCLTMTKPERGQGWTFLSRFLVVMQGSPRAKGTIFRRYESCRWCDSTERQLNNAIMFGRSARF